MRAGGGGVGPQQGKAFCGLFRVSLLPHEEEGSVLTAGQGLGYREAWWACSDPVGNLSRDRRSSQD